MLRYQSKNKVAFFAGLVLAVSGMFLLVCAAVAKGEADFLWLVGPLVLLLAVEALTYQCRMEINPSRKTVVKSVRVLGWSKSVRYSFSDFNKVEVLMGAGSVQDRAYGVYMVHLAGSSNLCIPGASEDREEMVEKARQVATTMGLPVEEEPKMGFVLNLWERLT